MSMRTVVAVAYGAPGDEDTICEVYTAPREGVDNPAKVTELVAGRTPAPGELDDPRRAARRREWISKMGGRVEQVPGFMLDAADAVSANLTRPVYDGDYAAEVGRVLAFDAEVDDTTGEVDWFSAVPHPAVDPRTPGLGYCVRADGAIIDPRALAEGAHRVKVDQEGRYVPHTDMDQRAVVYTEEDWRRHRQASIEDPMGRRDLLVVVGDNGTGRPGYAALPLEDVLGGAPVPDPRRGVAAHGPAYEAMRHAAGDQQTVLTRDGAPLRAMVVNVPCRTDRVPDHDAVVFDAMSAQPPTSDWDPRVLSVAPDGGLRLSASPQRAAPAPAGSQYVGAPAEMPPSMAATMAELAGAGRQSRRVAPGPSLTSGFDAGIDTAALHGAQSARSTGRRPLAGVSAAVRSAAAVHGPKALSAMRTRLEDPVLRERLRVAAADTLRAAMAPEAGTGKQRGVAAARAAMAHVDADGLARRAEGAVGAPVRSVVEELARRVADAPATRGPQGPSPM